MTQEKQRVAIATACGWKCAGHPDQISATQGWQFAYQFVIRPTGELVTHNSIPDYLADLNACHEMEKVLDYEQCEAFSNTVADIVQAANREKDYAFPWSFARIHATAAQRAEALLRTLGLWEKEDAQ